MDCGRHISKGLSADPRWKVGGQCCPSVKAMASVKQATLLLLIFQQEHLHSQPRGDTYIQKSFLKKKKKTCWALHGFASTSMHKQPWKGIFLRREDLIMAQQVNRKIPVYSMFVEINTAVRMVRCQFTPVLMPPAKKVRDGEQGNAGCRVLGHYIWVTYVPAVPVYMSKGNLVHTEKRYPQTFSHCSMWFTLNETGKQAQWVKEWRTHAVDRTIHLWKKWDTRLRMLSTGRLPSVHETLGLMLRAVYTRHRVTQLSSQLLKMKGWGSEVQGHH